MTAKRASWRISYYKMMDRCHNPNSQKYASYGAKGIIVCEAWRNNSKQFHADMGDRPEGTTLDRIDNSGIYEPSNCRWVDANEQSSNRTVARVIKFNGKMMTRKEASKASGISVNTLSDRLYRQRIEGEDLFAPVDIRFSRRYA